MKLRELAEKAKSGEVIVDMAGHRLYRDAKDRIVEWYEDNLAMSRGSHDGKWTLHAGESMERTNANMREHFERALDMEVRPEDMLFGLDDFECSGCGERLKFVLSGNILKLRMYWDREEHDFKIHPFQYACPYTQLRPLRGEIRVQSKLVFANFFREVEDSPEEKKYTDEWSLCSAKGRENITRYKAERNVAYGQMGNMSVGIYVHPDKRSIIVGDPYIVDRLTEGMTDEEYAKADKAAMSLIDGHKLVQTICLDVWRWEATDQRAIADMKKFREENKARGFVVLSVEPGVWAFEHYYCTGTSPNEYVYAKLYLKPEGD